MSDEPRLCYGCENPIDRELPNPLPEGYECMWSEQFTRRTHYCQACFDATPPADEEQP